MKFPRTRKYCLLAFVALAVFAAGVDAQSGRKQQEKPAPIQVPDPAPVQSGDNPPSADHKISALIVCGEVSHNYTYYNSNYFDAALKEFSNWMKYEPHPFLAVTRAGKMTFDAAKERAKKEIGSHVLWLGIVGKDNGLGEMIVQYVDYSILIPSTGKVLLTGRVIPGQQAIVAQGGVMKIPSIPKRSSELSQMKQGARQVADRLKSTGRF
jgi:hypothetical protein